MSVGGDFYDGHSRSVSIPIANLDGATSYKSGLALIQK